MTFLVVVVTFKPTMNVQRQNSVIKILQLIAPPPGGGGGLPWYTGTTVNPALTGYEREDS